MLKNELTETQAVDIRGLNRNTVKYYYTILHKPSPTRAFARHGKKSTNTNLTVLPRRETVDEAQQVIVPPSPCHS